MRVLLCLLLGWSWIGSAADRLELVQPVQFNGMCDASAGVAVSSNLFVAASDEDNVLRLYRNDRPGLPLKQYDFNAFLELHGQSLEADLEGAARIGDRAFWIGSHGRNKDGKARPNRCRLFATDIRWSGEDLALIPAGKPCKTLLDDLSRDVRFAQFHLPEAATRAPKDAGALDIEGLSATPEGHLLIGFRNPIPQGKALVVPLLNPNAVLEGKPCQFGDPLLLELGGLGIRDMAFFSGAFLIIAGAYDSARGFQFYRWQGPGSKPERVKVDHFNRYNPEAIIIYPNKGLREIQILSDDGAVPIDGVPGKSVTETARQAFRSFWLVP